MKEQTPSCYSDPGQYLHCVWCNNGSYDEIDLIEELMTLQAQNKAKRLGLSIRQRYYEPECSACMRKYRLEDVLKYICYDKNEISRISNSNSVPKPEQNTCAKKLNERDMQNNKLDELLNKFYIEQKEKKEQTKPFYQHADDYSTKQNLTLNTTTVDENKSSQSSQPQNLSDDSAKSYLHNDTDSDGDSATSLEHNFNIPSELNTELIMGVHRRPVYIDNAETIPSYTDELNNTLEFVKDTIEDTVQCHESSSPGSPELVIMNIPNPVHKGCIFDEFSIASNSIRSAPYEMPSKIENFRWPISANPTSNHNQNAENGSKECYAGLDSVSSCNVSTTSTGRSEFIQKHGYEKPPSLVIKKTVDDDLCDPSSPPNTSVYREESSDINSLVNQSNGSTIFENFIQEEPNPEDSLASLHSLDEISSPNESIFKSTVVMNEIEMNDIETTVSNTTQYDITLGLVLTSIGLNSDRANTFELGQQENLISPNRIHSVLNRHKSNFRINRYVCNEQTPPVLVGSEGSANRQATINIITSPDLVHIESPAMQITTTRENQMEEVKKMLVLAEKRANNLPLYTSQSNNSPNHIKRFIVPAKIKVSTINEIVAINDFKTNIIRDKIFKKGANGSYQNNWFQLKDYYLTCFNGKKLELCDKFNSQKGDLICPDDEKYYMTPKYSFDVRRYKIHVALNSDYNASFFRRLSCRRKMTDSIDLTDKNIKNILPYGRDYKIFIKEKEREIAYVVPFLELYLIKGTERFAYKFTSICEYLKWILAIELRQEKAIWPIP